MVRAARAAKPPLSPSLRRARTQACASFSTVRMPLPIASDSSTARSISPRLELVGDDIEMVGLAADDAAERDEAVIICAVFLGRIEGERDRRRNFQRARHGHHVIARAGLVERRFGAVQQGVGEAVIEARLDDQQVWVFGIGHLGLGTRLAGAGERRDL